jgi:hypothetical protein
MEESMIELLSGLIEGRNTFFGGTMNRISHTNRDAMLSRYFLNEICIIEVLNRIHQSYVRSSATSATLTFNLPANFLDSVQVSPTAAQIEAAVETVPSVSPGTQCAICQEALSADISRIRHCSHTFHRSCLSTWFGMSVRCPVCRYDIRGTDQLAQTSSDDE